VNGAVQFTYDNSFRVAGQSFDNGSSVTFDYDRDGLIVRAGELSILRDAGNGLVNGTALGAVTTTQTYNGVGEVTGYVGIANSDTLIALTYTRDQLGRITNEVERVQGDSVAYAYDYSETGRLVGVRTDGAPSTVYEYDAGGNLLRVTDGTGVRSGTYDQRDRVVSFAGSSYAYDASGSRTLKVTGADTTRYTYDALGSLIGVDLPGGTRVTYVVDGRGRRVGKYVNGQLVKGLLYSTRLRPVAELDGSGNLSSIFVYGSRANVPDYIIKAGQIYRILADQLGSVRLVVSIDGGVVAQRIDYDPYGRIIQNTNPGFQPFAFAGGLYDSDTRLTHFGVREYDAEVGRWLSRDPALFASNSVNLYEYALGDPVNHSDMNGLGWFPDLIQDVFGGASISVDVDFGFFLDVHVSGTLSPQGIDVGLGVGFGFGADVSGKITSEVSADLLQSGENSCELAFDAELGPLQAHIGKGECGVSAGIGLRAGEGAHVGETFTCKGRLISF